MKYTIDATEKVLGRVATEAAMILMGKNTPAFERHIAPKVTVTIINASKLAITAKKMKEKTYRRHSHYPGGEKIETMAQVAARKGYEEIVSKAVYGMLPDNKLRKVMMKNLLISE